MTFVQHVWVCVCMLWMCVTCSLIWSFQTSDSMHDLTPSKSHWCQHCLHNLLRRTMATVLNNLLSTSSCSVNQCWVLSVELMRRYNIFQSVIKCVIKVRVWRWNHMPQRCTIINVCMLKVLSKDWRRHIEDCDSTVVAAALSAEISLSGFQTGNSLVVSSSAAPPHTASFPLNNMPGILEEPAYIPHIPSSCKADAKKQHVSKLWAALFFDTYMTELLLCSVCGFVGSAPGVRPWPLNGIYWIELQRVGSGDHC